MTGRTAMDQATHVTTGALPRQPRITQALILIALAALGISVYLATASMGQAPIAGCGDDAGCDRVLASSWSSWLGVPTSLLAAATWLVGLIAVLACIVSRRDEARRVAWSVVLAVGVAAAGAAVWFIALQLTVLREICLYCMAAHGLALLFVLLVIVALVRFGRGGVSGIGGRRMGIAVAAAAVGVALLIGGQVLSPDARHVELGLETLAPVPPDESEPSTTAAAADRGVIRDSGPGPDRTISIGNFITFNAHEVAMVGSPDAPHIIATFFCYTCPHCGDLHRALAAARQRYDASRFAIATFPTPLEGLCNPVRAGMPTPPRYEGACEYAMIALAVWRTEPAKFEAYEHWFFETSDPRPVETVRAHAADLVGADRLRQALDDPATRALLDRGIAFMNSFPPEHVTVPMTFMGQRTILAGAPTRAELFRRIETEFGLSAAQGLDDVNAISP
jgi:uncharacterized membrane protein